MDAKGSTMSLKIIPLAVPSVNWQTFLLASSGMLGYDVSQPIVESRSKFNPLSKAIIAYSAFNERPSQQAVQILRTSYQALSHFYFSFLLLGEPDFISQIANYAMVNQLRASTEHGVILSADLWTWKQVIEYTLKPGRDYDLRVVFWDIFKLFEKMGLGDLWWDSSKQERTRLLEHRK